jgi:hypothetical protein
MKVYIDQIDKAHRNTARHEILDAVNDRSTMCKFTMKSIREAVHFARQNNLVRDEVYVSAGFNPQ